MSEQTIRVCRDCNTTLRPSLPTDTCPACGSTNIQHDRAFEIKAVLAPHLNLRLSVTNAPGPTSKAPTEIVVKPEIYRDTGAWQQVHRTFGRADDEYIETITDLDTGRVILEKRERLSEHRNPRKQPDRSEARRGNEGWTAYTRVAPESSTPRVDVLQNDPAPAPARASGHAGLSIKELSRRRDALRREHDAYFRGKARELLTGNEAVIETTAGIVRGRLVRFRSGAVFEQWHSSADGMGHAMSRIELEELDDPAPFLVDSLVRAVLSLGPEAQPLR